MTYTPEAAVGGSFDANPALNVADVYLDAWWNLSAVSTDWNVAQTLRRVALGNHKYQSLLCACGTPLGWNVAKSINGVYSEILPTVGAPTANTWIRVGIAMVGTTYRLFLNGNLVTTAEGLVELTSGNVGFVKFVVPDGTQLWIDDVVARPYVFPEPTTSLGPEQPAP